ncbi:MAG: uroporphyrinogen-III C-methyltransferase [Aeromonadaceae bacterium]
MSAKVWLVGAGPGDPGLITVKGLSCIRQADALVYDRLVCADLLAEAPVGCELINVGQRADHHPVPQEEINGILIRQAQLGRQVVRLKGGDPYVFGRGGEEAEALALLGIPFEVVPGITSAIGGLAYAGIPVTHRSHASAFHVITGHLQAGKAPLDWATLARLDGTLVFLMGMSQLDTICHSLIRHGMDPQTPAAAVMQASQHAQRMSVGNLTSLPRRVEEDGLRAPALIVIGEVVQLHDLLKFVPTAIQLDETLPQAELA